MNKQLNDFFSSQALYKPLVLEEDYNHPIGIETPYDFQGATFSYQCLHEQEIKTFEIELPAGSSAYWGGKPGNVIPQELFKEGRLDFIQHLVGRCRSCKLYHVDFLVHTWSTKPIDADRLRDKRILMSSDKDKGEKAKEERNSVLIEKVGVSAETKFVIDKEVSKYFDRETNSWYFKAKKALNENLGIGSFAYFRRIIEKELIKIVNDISTLNSADSAEILELLSKFNTTGKVHLLYENVFQYLPKSLQSLGDNPIKILYQQTSEGLHILSEDECTAKASQIDLVLKFVIKKINEEKSDILQARNALRALRS